MSAIEHELLEKIGHLDEEQQRKVLDFIQSIEAPGKQSGTETYSVSELMKLPAEERNRLVAAALASAADEDFETFEAYGEEDMDAIP